MSEAASKNVSNLNPVHFQQTRLKARIENSEFRDGVYYVSVICPALDEFSQPSKFQVQSSSQLGQQGEIVDLNIRLEGWVTNFNYTDKATGQPRKGINYKTRFIAIH